MKNTEICWTHVAVRSGRSSKYKRCNRKGKIERDGHWYCLQHDPVAWAAETETMIDIIFHREGAPNDR